MQLPIMMIDIASCVRRTARNGLSFSIAAMLVLCVTQFAVAQNAIPITELNRTEPVHFEKEILPVLQKNCLACHSESERNGELVMETPAAMLKGGESGPAIVAGNSKESLLVQLASHQDDPIMPPEDNDVAAQNLTSAELGLISLWIDQGAKTAVGSTGVLSPVTWRPLPPGSHPIYAAAVSPDGQFAACGKANQIFIYHVATGQLVTKLTDPELQSASKDKLPGIAHMDVVQSLSFNKQGDMLASGGFRTVKLWKYPRDVQEKKLAATENVLAVAVSPDQKTVAVATADNQIILWNPEDEKPGLTLEGHSAEIRGLSFNESGEKLVSVSADKSIRVWNITDGKPAGLIQTPAEINSVATVLIPILVVPGEPVNAEQPAKSIERIVTGGADNLIRVWEFPESLTSTLAETPPGTKLLATSRDGKWIAMANELGIVRVIRTETNELLHQWEAGANLLAVAIESHVASEPTEPADPNAVQPQPELAPRLATAFHDGSVRVWDAKEGKLLTAFRGSNVSVNSVSFRPDGKQLATGAADGAVSTWNLDSIDQQIVNGESGLSVATTSPDGKRLASSAIVNDRPAIVIRDLESGKVLNTLLGHDGPIVSIAFSKDGLRLVSGSADNSARVWNLQDPKFPEAARFAEHTGAVSAVAFNADATQVLSGSADNSVKLWSVADAKIVMDFPGHTGPVVAVGMLANNQPVSASADKRVLIWNPANGQPARTITETTPITSMSIRGDAAQIAVAATDNLIKLHPSAGGNPTATINSDQPVTSLSYSADNLRLLSQSKTAASVWDVSDGRLLEILDVNAGAAEAKDLSAATFSTSSDRVVLCQADGAMAVRSLRFQAALRGIAMPVTKVDYPNGQTLFVSSEDNTLRGFTLANSTQVFAANHAAPIHSFAVSPDGTRLASAGADMLIKNWNATNGVALQPPQFAGFTAPVQTIAFSADGSKLVGGSGEAGETGEVLVFNLAANLPEEQLSAKPVSALCAYGDAIVFATSEGTVQESGLHAVNIIPGHTGPVTSVATIAAIDAQPPQIISGSADGTARRWNAVTNAAIATLNHGGPVTAVSIRADGQRIASASTDKTVKLWNGANNQQVAQMLGDIQAKTLVAKVTQQKADATTKLAAAKATLVASETDLPVKTTAEKTAADALTVADTDVEAKAAVLTKASTDKAAAEKLAIDTAAAAQLASKVAAQANQLAVDLTAKTNMLNDKVAMATASASVDPTNAALAKAVTDAQALAAKADAESKAAEAAKAAPMKAAADAATAAQAEATKALATNRPFNDAATALALAQRVQQSAKQNQQFAARDLKIATELIPVAQKAVADAEALLQQLDAELVMVTKAEVDAQLPVHSLAFSPDGRTLASGGDLSIIHTWNAENGKAISSCVGHAASVKALCFVTDDTVVSGAGDKNAIVWNLNPQWQLERVIGNIADSGIFVDRVASVDFNPDGTLIATGGGVPSRGGQIKIFNVSDGTEVREMIDAHTDVVNCVEFSPDGLLVASASADKYVKTFEIDTGKVVNQFEGHTNHALGVSWRAGGKMLASCGADMTIRIWNAETGDRINTILGYTRQVASVRFIGQTQFIVSSSGDSFVRKHNADNGGVQTNYAGPADYMYCIDATQDPDNGIVVAGGHDGLLRVWTANGTVLHALDVPQPMNELAKDVAAE